MNSFHDASTVSKQLFAFCLQDYAFRIGPKYNYFLTSTLSCLLSVNKGNIARRRNEFGVTSLTESFTDIDNTSLDEIVREILHVNPRIGFRLVQGALRQQGITVQRRRILGAMRRVDPVMIT